MANRIRSVYPDILESEDFASWSPWAQIAFVKVWTKMDDQGRIKDNPRWLSSILFPFNEEVGTAQMARIVDEWVGTRSVCRYEVADEKWLHCVNWHRFQKPQRPTKSKIPPCPIHDGSLSTHGALSEGSSPEGRGEERRGGEGSGTPPIYSGRCTEHGNLPTPPKCGACADVRKTGGGRALAAVAELPAAYCSIHGQRYATRCSGCAADEKAAES